VNGTHRNVNAYKSRSAYIDEIWNCDFVFLICWAIMQISRATFLRYCPSWSFMSRFLLFVALISPNRMHIPPSISRRWWQVSESWISRIHFLYSLSLSFSLSLSLLSQIIIDPQSAVKSFFSSLLLSWSPVCSKRTLNPSQKCEKFKWNVNFWFFVSLSQLRDLRESVTFFLRMRLAWNGLLFMRRKG